MRRVWRWLTFGLLLILAIGATPNSLLAAPRQGAMLPALAAHATSADACAGDFAIQLLDLINTYRVNNGQQRLALSKTLTAAAQHHSDSMATHDYFSHDLIPEGITPFQNMINHGYTYNTWKGENLAGGQTTPQEVFAAWQNSAGHNATMLSDKFVVAGFGLAINENTTYHRYWTLNVGGHADAAARPCGAGGGPGDDGDDGSESLPQTAALRIRGSSRSANSSLARRAFDGKPATTWQSVSKRTPKSAVVVFDLGSVKTVATIEWMIGLAGADDALTIAVSNNRQNWTQVISTGGAAPDTWQSVPYGGNARYIRFAFSNPNGDRIVGKLSEVRFIGG